MDTPTPTPAPTPDTLPPAVAMPEPYMPPVRYGRSGGLIVIFMLGVCVGAAVCYGVLSAMGAPLPNPGITADVDAIPTPDAPTDALADVNGLWPARHLAFVLDEPTLSAETLEVLAAFKPGAVLVPPGLHPSAEAMQDYIGAVRRAVGRNGVPIVIAADAGNANPLAVGPPPAYASLASVGDKAMVMEAASGYGASARALGFDAALAPSTSLQSPGQADPQTAWTADPTQSAQLVQVYTDAFSAEGLVPIPLAFPGMGLAQPNGSPRQYVVREPELRTLASHMVPLREVAALGVPGMLATHTAVPELDKRYPDRPATLSPTLLGILRTKWNYDGVVLGDDVRALAVATARPVEELFVEMLGAGCDAVVLSNPDRTTLRRICATLVALVDAGGLDLAALDESKARLNRWQEIRSEFGRRAKSTIPAPQPEGTELLRHTVQQGETLVRVAMQYSVKLSDLKAWNGLMETPVAPGQKLNVYLPKADGAAPEEPARQVIEEPLPEEALPAAEPEAAPAPEPKQEEEKPAKKEDAKKPAKPEPKPEPKVEPEPEATPMEVVAPAATPEPAPAPLPMPAPEASSAESKEESAPLVPVDAAAPEEQAPEPAAPAQPALKMGKFHVWQEGDTLESVAAAFGITVQQLKDWNLFDVAPPSPGMEVVVVGSNAPPPVSPPTAPTESLSTHVVQTGETLYRIADTYGVTKDKLIELNGLKSADLIWVGQKLKVPAKQ